MAASQIGLGRLPPRARCIERHGLGLTLKALHLSLRLGDVGQCAAALERLLRRLECMGSVSQLQLERVEPLEALDRHAHALTQLRYHLRANCRTLRHHEVLDDRQPRRVKEKLLAAHARAAEELMLRPLGKLRQAKRVRHSSTCRSRADS